MLLAVAVPALSPAAQPEAPGAQQPSAKPKLSRLQGRAVAGPRDGVVGATVLVQARGDTSRVYLTSSGESGAFAIDGLPDGEYRVQVARPGLNPVTKDRVNVRFPFRAVVEVDMEPGAGQTPLALEAPAEAKERIELQGGIREQDGSPMPEVRVRLVRIDGSLDPHSLRTASDGRFVFPDLRPGGWRLEIRGVGFLTVRQPIELNSDTELGVTMVRQPPQYEPSPLELMPPERPVPPEGFEDPG